MEAPSLFNEEELFVGVDFHVHTPASNCYKGPRTEKEYLDILRRYNSKKIKVIAITDHNTLQGYKNFLKIKRELVSKLAVLGEYVEKHPNLKDDYLGVKEDLELYNKVLLLPGIEFEANPGIHLLLIFDPKTETDLIDKFLVESGYIDEVQGKENPGTTSNMDVLNILEKSKELGCIVIAAHADSDKGIYNNLEGLYRANVFRSNQLTAISYNNPKNHQKMKQLLQNKEYSRELPLAFIQSSDNHGQIEPGTNITYLKLNEFNFETIFQALRNPNECVSPTERPEVINILREIVNDHKSITFNNLESDLEQMEIQKAICAILNEGYGTLVIGVTKNPELNIMGVSQNSQDLYGIINSLLENVNPSQSYTSKIELYPFGSNKQVVSLSLKTRINRIYYLKTNEVFILRNNKIKSATLPEIEEIIENRIISRMVSYQKIVEPRLDKLIKGIEQIKERTEHFSLINNVERISTDYLQIMEIQTISPFVGDFIIQIMNGSPNGNVVYIERVKPRLAYTYLRCSAPRTDTYNSDQFDLQKFKGTSIVIAPSGGSFIVNFPEVEEWCVIALEKNQPALVTTVRDSYKKNFSELSLLGWLKSTVFLWYCQIAFGDINIHRPLIYKTIKVPKLKVLEPGEIIENLVLQILSKEQDFLSLNRNDYSEEHFGEIIQEHNLSVEKFAIQIDQLLFKEFNMNQQDLNNIKKVFQFNNIYFLEQTIEEEVNNLQNTHFSLETASSS
ncbi:MAG: hypothetical protein JWM44_4447 [Bacilli bacterium]|nr:hypothetical protein [Bacilli bacterium]